jgi:hypothetical protein
VNALSLSASSMAIVITVLCDLDEAYLSLGRATVDARDRIPHIWARA